MNCLLCQQPLRGDWALAQLLSIKPLTLSRLCAQCLAQFTPIAAATVCPGCGRAHSPKLCADCQRWLRQGYALLHNRAWFSYTPAMKAFIQQYKGQGDYRLHQAFADQMQLSTRRTALVPLPSEPGHYARRGFDPVIGLFGHLPLALWLEKADTAVPQAQKDRQGRLQTPQSFTAHLPAKLPPQVILLDDLYTTGRTLYHAQAALRQAGYQGKIMARTLIR